MYKKVLNISGEFLHLEIIIIDNCSTDGSHSIARDCANKDPRFFASFSSFCATTVYLGKISC